MFADLADVRASATWKVRQKDAADRATAFIYDCRKLVEVREAAARYELTDDLMDYSEHRWRNYWRHDAWLYLLLAEVPGTRPFENERDRTRDLYVPFGDGSVTIDLKVTRIPRSLSPRATDREFALNFYANQSTQGRFHLDSRLFVVGHPEESLYDGDAAIETVGHLDLEATLFEAELGRQSAITGVIRHGRAW